jgi:hypothetical protein
VIFGDLSLLELQNLSLDMFRKLHPILLVNLYVL